MGRMVGDSGTEAELLRLLWQLMHDRDLKSGLWPHPNEREQSTLDQIDLQIVRCLALLALVRQEPEEPPDAR
jgi:hypothetical protein